MRLPLIAIISLLILACQSSPGEVKADPSFRNDISAVFNRHCISCHSGASPAAGYDLSSHAGTLGPGSDSIPNVIPGNAAASRLWQRLADGTMPPGGRLDTVDIANVRNWINQGARDN